MKASDIHARGYATLLTDQFTQERHFDCGAGERYTLPVSAVFCADFLKDEGYPRWVARISDVRAAAGVVQH